MRHQHADPAGAFDWRAVPGQHDTPLPARSESAELRAFELFYDRHSSVAFNLAVQVLHDRGLAADATQEGFLRFWRYRARYRPEPSAGRSLLLTMVRNCAIDSLRRERRRRTDPDSELLLAGACSDADTVKEALLSQQVQNIHSMLKLLPADQRRVIELGYFGGLTHVEIAAKLGLSLGTTKGRMRLGLDKLRVVLAESDKRDLKLSPTGAC